MTSIRNTAAEGMARIPIDRPEKHNAITPEMIRELRDACAEVDRDDAVRVAIIFGGGKRSFSAGSDMNSLTDLSDPWAFPQPHRICRCRP
ncbi:MAG: hypothetical protein NVSMB26_01660 [Beijerinckiaceae bacterium]